MSDAFSQQHADLARLTAQARLRALAPRVGIDFASNDYLGLAQSPALRDAATAALSRGVPIGSGGSRLLRGNHPEHEALEAEAAGFLGAEAALFFPTGFSANSALLSTMPQRDDHIFADALVHASMHEGLRLTRAHHSLFAHNDMAALDAAIAAWRARNAAGRAWICVESLYSMDGDTAPIAALAAVAERHGAILVADEAHATGVLGPQGRGLLATLPARPATAISLHTLGKALGVEGALLAGPKVLRETLVNRARGFIFSTAPSPLIAAVAREALRICASADDRRATLTRRIALADRLLAPLGATVHGAPIVPLIIGGNAETMAVAARLQAQGFDVRGIRPPTVPVGTSRLRIVITLNVDEAQIAGLAHALADARAGAPA